MAIVRPDTRVGTPHPQPARRLDAWTPTVASTRGKDAQTCPTLGGLERNRLGIQGSGRFGQSARPWNRRSPGAFLFYFCVPVSDPAQTRRAVRDRPHYTTGQCWRNMRDNLRESSFTGSDRIGRRGAAQPTANDPSASCPRALRTILRKPFPSGLGPSCLECTSSRPDESTIHDCFAVPPPSLGASIASRCGRESICVQTRRPTSLSRWKRQTGSSM